MNVSVSLVDFLRIEYENDSRLFLNSSYSVVISIPIEYISNIIYRIQPNVIDFIDVLIVVLFTWLSFYVIFLL